MPAGTGKLKIIWISSLKDKKEREFQNDFFHRLPCFYTYPDNNVYQLDNLNLNFLMIFQYFVNYMKSTLNQVVQANVFWVNPSS